jgi:hydroxymethylglutaryl-CoA reductase
LACVIASAGLAQNLAAIRALSTEGIQNGHMKLHAKNIAVAAGATGKLVDIVSKTMHKQSKISLHSARRILQELHDARDSSS